MQDGKLQNDKRLVAACSCSWVPSFLYRLTVFGNFSIGVKQPHDSLDPEQVKDAFGWER
jgi:hypothetical protein